MTIKKRTLIALLVLFSGIIIGMVTGSTFGYWLVTALIFVICISLGIKEGRVINPYFLFALTPLTLLCYFNISDTYMVDLTKDTWQIAVLNIGGFIFGLSIHKGYRTRYSMEKYELSGHRLIVATWLLSMIGFLPRILAVFFGVMIPLYSVFVLFDMAALVCALKTRKKGIIAVVMLINVLTWFINVTKTSVLTTCICLLVVYETYYVLTPKQRKRLLILGVAGVFVMLYAFTFANQSRGTSGAEITLQYFIDVGGVKWNRNAALFLPYMYLETPWTNLQYVMETQNTHTYGLWVLKPFLNYFQIDGFFSGQYSLIPKSSFNTFTYITCMYKDFGTYGSAVISVLLGCFVRWVYSRANITKNPLDVACYVYTAQAVLQMFFSNHFFQQSYPITIVLGVALFKYFVLRLLKK